MARPSSSHGWLISTALAGLVLAAPAAMAGDRYGPGDGPDRGRAGEEIEAVDPCAVHQRVTGLDCRVDGRREQRVYRDERVYRDQEAWRGGDADLEQVDPCAAQARVLGYGCEVRDGRREAWSHGFDDRRAHVEERYVEGGRDRAWVEGGRRFEDIEEVDPCAVQSRVIGYGCERGGYVRETYAAPRRVWRSEEADGYDDRFADDGRPVYVHGGADYGYVEDCIALHARIGDRCPYERRERIVESMALPADFFVSEGGVGGGIVDFGGGGGGGGFAFSDSFANAAANANASASASASAIAKVNVSIMNHNHMMKMHYPMKWGGGGMHHGCGCKK